MIERFSALRGLNFPINHVAFVVPDIEEAVAHWTALMGAGPFFVFQNMAFDYREYSGGKCTFEHSAAFGQCGPIAIELQQFQAIAPAPFAAKMAPGGVGSIGHVGYVSRSIDEESARLEAAGYPLFFRAGAGDMEARFHDTSSVLGFSIEVHRRCDFIDTFFVDLAEAARDWDGTDPLRQWAPNSHQPT